MTLQFGVLVPQGWTMDLAGIKDPVEAYETMTRVAQTAEEVGFASAWLVDHFHTIPHPTPEVTFECWMSTAALARDTNTIRLGPLVASFQSRSCHPRPDCASCSMYPAHFLGTALRQCQALLLVSPQR